MLSVTIYLLVMMLSVVILSVNMLSVVLQSVVLQSVVLQSVVVPFKRDWISLDNNDSLKKLVVKI